MSGNNEYKIENFSFINGDCSVYTNEKLNKACKTGNEPEFKCNTYKDEELKACLCGYNINYCVDNTTSAEPVSDSNVPAYLK